jgi:hypothetical protein
MGRIVTNGRAVAVLSKGLGSRRTQGGCEIAALTLPGTHAYRPHVSLKSNRKERTQRVLLDLVTVQNHFGGLSRSEALRISLALTANAIRQGRMNVSTKEAR